MDRSRLTALTRMPVNRPLFSRVPWWKLLGAAGLMGVAATGVVATRQERARRAMTPDEIRSRLHERHRSASHRTTAP